MKGDTRRVEGRNGTDTMAKREIAGNTYLVIVVTMDSDTHSHTVIAYADKVNGHDLGFPDNTMGYVIRNSDWDELVHGKVKHSEELALVISKVVNQAVGKLTGHLEDTKSQEDAVLGALEANAEVHEGDE
jgi:hypothetical protein